MFIAGTTHHLLVPLDGITGNSCQTHVEASPASAFAIRIRLLLGRPWSLYESAIIGDLSGYITITKLLAIVFPRSLLAKYFIVSM